MIHSNSTVAVYSLTQFHSVSNPQKRRDKANKGKQEEERRAAAAAMASAMATNRLRKEYLSLQRSPVENIQAAPLEKNILEWHYVITGTPDTPYAGGFYHGKLRFPPEYPMKPPAVLMLTPNGRFEVNRRICLSMSDFHPETWNPVWAVASILTGLYSFMLEDQMTTGSIETSDDEKRAFATASLAVNCQDKDFRTLFPHLVELHAQQQQQGAAAPPPPASSSE